MWEWLVGLVGEEGLSKATPILAFAFVILLVLILFWIARKVFSGGSGLGSRNRVPRLAVLDVTGVDPKRKLVLVRRDETEHLLLIGGQNDLVVEANISRVPAGASRGGRVDPSLRLDRARSDGEPMMGADVTARRPAPAAPRRPAAPPPRAHPEVRERQISPDFERDEGGDFEQAPATLPLLPAHDPSARRSSEPEVVARAEPQVDMRRERSESVISESVQRAPAPLPVHESAAEASSDLPERAAPPASESEAPPVLAEATFRPISDPLPGSRPVAADPFAVSAQPVEAPVRPARTEPPPRPVPSVPPPPRADSAMTAQARPRAPAAQQTAVPRSMATPTLPGPARPTTSITSDAASPSPAEIIVEPPLEESRTAAEESAGPANVPAVDAPARNERLAAMPVVQAKPLPPPSPETNARPAGERKAAPAEGGGPQAATADRVEPPEPAISRVPATEPSNDRTARQPLSVRSFASAIQAHRAPAAPAPAVAPAAREAAPVAPAVPPRPAEPVEAVDVDDSLSDLLAAEFTGATPFDAEEPSPANQDARPSQPPRASAPAAPEPPAAEMPKPPAPSVRNLSIEEEMERLLKDFTVGVSNRR